MIVGRSALLASLICSAGPGIAVAQDAAASFRYDGRDLSIRQSATVDPASIVPFLRREEGCDDPCVAPLSAGDGIATVDELTVLGFLRGAVARGDGLLIDARSPDRRSQGAIPASVNVPVTLLGTDNPYRVEILLALGAREMEGAFNFADALPLTIYDDGPATFDAPRMIATLADLGYPVDRLSYYRGGLRDWAALGLTIEGARE